VIRVGIADDHHLVREGIRALLERAADIEVIGEANDGIEAVQLALSLAPNVLVMDVTMPRQNGIEATQAIRAADLTTEVVMLSMHTEPALVRRSMQAGAKGYVLKGSVTEELLLAVRAAAQGATYLSPVASASILETTASSSEPLPGRDKLTPRELEVLQLIGEGLTNRAIGSHLGISVKTVERHRTRLMAKLDAHSIVELMREAFRQGLLDIEK